MKTQIFEVTDRLRKAAALLNELFAGRRDGYGTHTPNVEDSDVIIKEPVTDSVWLRHVRGEAPIGIFPITLAINGQFVCRWASIDVDRRGDLEGARSIAERIHLANPRLRLFWERSRGKGYHGWVFFMEDTPVISARHMLLDLIRTAGLHEHGTEESELRVFPRQNQLGVKGWGNFMYLPLFGGYAVQGRTVFVDPDRNWQPVLDQVEYLQQLTVTRLPAWWATEGVPGDNVVQLPGAASASRAKVAAPLDEGIRADAESLPALSDEEVRQLRRLDSIRSAMDKPNKIGYEQWLAMLVHLVPFANGNALAHSISRLDTRRYDESAVEEKWREALKIYNRADRAGAVSISQAIIDHLRGGGAPEVTPLSGKYCVYKGRISLRSWRMNGDKFEEMLPIPLCNFSASIIAKEISSDGIGEESYTRLRGNLAGGRALPEIRVSNHLWHKSMEWIPQLWGTDAIVNGARKEQGMVVEALQHTGLDAPTVRTYTHTGWAEIDGKWGFLNAGGVAGMGDGGISVSSSQVALPPNLMRYNIPSECPEEKALLAYTHLERFFDAAGLHVTTPLVAALFLAPLRTLLNLDFCVFLVGKTGTRKSSLVAAALSFYGKEFTRNSLPESFQSTVNSVERTAFCAKDLPLAIDNFVPSLHIHGGQSVLSRVAHSVGDGVGRGRLTRGGIGQQHAKPPRALLILTGEEGAYGESTAARFYTVQLSENTVMDSMLEYIQLAAERDELRWLSAHYLSWLAPQMEDPTFAGELRKMYSKELKDMRSGLVHRRLPEQEAWIRVGLRLAEMSHPHEQWREGSLAAHVAVSLDEARSKRAEEQRHAMASSRVLSQILALIQRGQVYAGNAQSPTERPWVHAEMFGWGAAGRMHPNAIRCLWIDSQKISGTWLLVVDPEVTVQLLNEALPRDTPPWRERSIENNLDSDGLLHTLEANKKTVRTVIGNDKRRGWLIDGPKMMKLLDLEDEVVIRVKS